MKHKLALLSAALLASAVASAQDKIKFRNGDLTEAKVVEVTPKDVTYKRWDNQTGPDYRVNRGDIASIQYENGSFETFGRSEKAMAADEARQSRVYGRNLLSLAPLQFTDISIRGVGLYYERSFGKSGIVAIQFPVVLAFPDASRNYRGYDGVFTHIYPGLKIYPRGNRGVVKYAIGPSLAFGIGRRDQTIQIYDPVTGQSRFSREQSDVFSGGIMVNNSLNINPSEHLYMGLELGLGFNYTNNTSSNQYYYQENTPLANFNFKIGYRF